MTPNILVTRDDGWADFKLWHYTPNIPAAIIFTIAFLVFTGYHGFLLIRRRTWFCIPFVVGGALEVIGYIGRAMAHGNTDSVPIYTMQTLCLLLAPILFAASIYMILGRIIRALNGEQHSFIRVNWLTKIFVGGDVFCFMLQGAGGGLLSVAKDQAGIDRGNNIILGGLVLQILIFLVFLSVALMFQLRLRKRPTPASLDGPLGSKSSTKSGRFGTLTWTKLMLGLYATSILITVRNLFRVIEYGMGWGSYLLSNEWPLYVFDGLLMVMVLAVCIMWYNPAISKNNYAGPAREVHNLESGQTTRPANMSKNERGGSQPWS